MSFWSPRRRRRTARKRCSSYRAPTVSCAPSPRCPTPPTRRSTSFSRTWRASRAGIRTSRPKPASSSEPAKARDGVGSTPKSWRRPGSIKSEEGREILRKLVARADIFGQNFRPGAAEKNGFGYDDLRRINPKLVYISISGYGPKGPNAHLPGTDSMAQALGGIAQAYATPGQPLKTGIVSVADETCAILAFGGALAALTHARATGIGQKVDCSLLGGQSRLRGWTLTTAMWRNRDPVTGQARITGT